MRSVGLTLVLLCGVAVAQPKNKSTELFEEGRALAGAGKIKEACDKFDESYKLDRAPGTALNYGDCLEKLGQLRRAWQMFDSAAKDFARDNDGRAPYAKQRAETVSPKLAAITVKVANPQLPGLVIEIGDQTVTPAEQIEDRFEPGDIVVRATAPGKQEFSTRANGLAGSSVIVDIPAELGTRLVEVTQAMGLVLSGIDLRRTPGGEWCAFEVNPSPGFSFYEEGTGQPIADAIAGVLIGAAAEPTRGSGRGMSDLVAWEP